MSFAKEYWEEFEKLSIDLLKTYFMDIDESKISVNKTQSQKDGGYDGVVIISAGPDKMSYRILSESKLRALSTKDLPMSDFSKTLVIAINLAAHEVYIFTNLHFSNETQLRISIFSKMTNIKVNLRDIFHVVEDIKNLPSVEREKYSKTLINELINSVKTHPLERKTDFKHKGPNSVLEKLIGTKRTTLLENACELIKSRTGIYIVSGSQGSGKSFFIQHLTSLMYEDKPYLCTYIDMVRFSNIKDFFITLLSVIWKIDILDIANFTQEDIEEITAYIPDTDMSLKARHVLLDIITSQAEPFFSSKDLMYNYLMEYLHRIYSPILSFKKQFLVFHNIDYATDFAKDILLMFMKRFYKENIVIILEIRNETVHTRNFLNQCKKEVQIIEEFEMSDLDHTETKTYLDKKYSDIFKKEELDALQKICPQTPLLIDQVVKLFASNKIYRSLLNDSLQSIYELYKNPKYLGKVSSSYVNHVMCSYDKDTQKCAASIAFMDGRMDTKYISMLCENAIYVIEQLLETHLFVIKGNGIEIYHVSVLKPLREMSYINSKLTRIETFQQLYYVVDEFDIFPQKKNMKKLCLALELADNVYVSENWKSICSILMKEKDYEVALELLQKVYDLLNEEFDNVDRFWELLWIFQCLLEKNAYQQDELEIYIKDLDAIICNGKKEISHTEVQDYLLLKARYYLAIGKYKELIQCVNKYSASNPRLYNIQALGIKHTSGIDLCIETLAHGIEIFPNDKYIRYSYYDHLLSKAFKYDLPKTKECIQKMKPYIDILSLEDLIHYKYNEQSALFYNSELESLDDLNKLMIMSFQNNLPVEQSRICNLIGQFYWAEKDTTSAIEFFSKAAELQFYTKHQTYWWIAKTNLALLFHEVHNEQKSIELINEVFDIHRSNKWKKVKEFFSQSNISLNTIIFDKQIVSFLLLLLVLYEKNETDAKKIVEELISDNIICPQKKWFTKEFLSSQFYIELKQTSYYFGKHYMIKC